MCNIARALITKQEKTSVNVFIYQDCKQLVETHGFLGQSSISTRVGGQYIGDTNVYIYNID